MCKRSENRSSRIISCTQTWVLPLPVNEKNMAFLSKTKTQEDQHVYIRAYYEQQGKAGTHIINDNGALTISCASCRTSVTK